MIDKLKAVGYEDNYDLESLLKMFPEGQLSISRLPESFVGWRAVCKDGELRGEGSTPQEALANLYIKTLSHKKYEKI